MGGGTAIFFCMNIYVFIFVLLFAAVSGISAQDVPEASEKPSATETSEIADTAESAETSKSSSDISNLKKRAEVYRRTLEGDPDNFVILTNLGLVELALRNSQDAEKFLKRAVRVRMENAPAWLALGTLYMDERRDAEAFAALAQAALYDERNAQVHNFLGVIYSRRGWFDAAEAELRSAVELNPAYADAHFNLAVFYLGHEKPLVEPAKRHYFRALDLGAPKDDVVEGKLKSFAESP